MGMDNTGMGSDALVSSARSELWAANALGAAALEQLHGHAEVTPAQLASVRDAAEALIVAVTPVVSNRTLVAHVVGVAHALHGG